MKKTILILALSILYAGVSVAQVKFGLTAGLNGSNTTAAYEGGGSKTTNYMKAGFQAGAVMDFGLTDHLSLLPENTNIELDLCKLSPEGIIDKNFANNGVWHKNVMQDFDLDHEYFLIFWMIIMDVLYFQAQGLRKVWVGAIAPF